MLKKENQYLQSKEIPGVPDRHSCKFHEICLQILEFQKNFHKTFKEL